MVKILILGNGFGGVYTLKNLQSELKAHKEARISMAGERNYFLFTPLLHEVATGSLMPQNIIEPIRQVVGPHLANFHLGKAGVINLENRTVEVGGELVSYDYLVLAAGATTNFFETPGAAKHTFTLKSIEDAVKIKNHVIRQMERASRSGDSAEIKTMLRFVVVGGGPTGVEFVAELAEFIQESFSKYYTCDVLRYVSILLIQRDKELVPQLNQKIRSKTLKVLREKGITVMLESAVKEAGPGFAQLSDGTRIETETVVWVAGIKPNETEFSQEVPKTPDGKIIVNRFLQIEGHPRVFALGDGAAFTDKNTGKLLPALAQVAEKQSKCVAKNISSLINSKPLKEFEYRSSGSLISLGQWMAAGEILGFTLSGRFTWWLWRTIYLIKFLSLRKKVRVAIDWTMNIFSPRDISEL